MRSKFILPEKLPCVEQPSESDLLTVNSPKNFRLSAYFLLFSFLFLSFTNVSLAQQSLIPCNGEVPTPLTSAISSKLVATETTSGICTGLLGCGIDNPERMIDASLSNFARVRFGTSVGTVHTLTVTDTANGRMYDSSTFAGFLVENSGLNLGALSNIRVRTLLDGVPRDSSNANSLLALQLLGSNQYYIGINATKSFDAVEIRFTQGVSLVVATTDVFYAVIRKGCVVATPTCNTPTPLARGGYPAYVVDEHTGFSGVSIGTITTPDAAVDNNPATAAQIDFTVGILATASFAVRDRWTTYPVGTYAGFDISNTTLVSASLLGTISIVTYLNGAPRDSLFGTSLLSVPTSLLNGSGRTKIGIVATQSFDEVRIMIRKTAGLTIGTTNIHSAVIQTFCPGPALVCNTPTVIGAPQHPVIISSARTGIIGVDALSSINNTDSIIDQNPSTYGTIMLSGALNSGRVAVRNRLTTYPKGTFAGYDIESTGLLSVNALGALTISVYRNDTLKQSKTGTNSLVAVSTGLLTGSNRQVLGFAADSAFDEVVITVANTANVTLGTVRVYSLVVKSLCAKTITCNANYNLINKDFPVIVNSQRTGFDGAACALCSIEGADNVIDSVTANYGLIHIVAGALGSGSIAVKDPTTVYPAGTFAGFNIQDVTGILKVNLLNSITISTYRHDSLIESRASSNLIDLTALITLFGSGTNQYNVGFITAQPFDEIVISVGAVVGAVNNVRVFGAVIDTRTAFGGGLLCRVLNPDFNATLINVQVAGNVSSNDVVSANTTYGTSPTAAPGNPAGGVLTMQSTGTYTFTTPNVGVYTYYVPVCQESQTANCATRPLVITVTNDAINTNPPIANADIATTKGSPVTVKTLANDECANPGCSLNPASVTVPAANTTGGPSHGTVSVNPANGDITFTPTPGFVGTDSITYTVCDYQSTPRCATAKQYFTILPADAGNTTVAVDDYISTWQNITRTGNVKTNDSDAEGNTQSVTPQTTTITGKGTLTLLADGSYTFVPAVNFRGPVDYVYTTCDNGTPQACASATLHILTNGVPAVPELTPEILVDTMTLSRGGSTTLVPVTFRNNGTIPTSSQIVISIAKINNQFTLSIDPNANGTLGTEAYDNRNWDVVEQAHRFVLTSKAGFSINPGAAASVALGIQANGLTTSTANLSVEIVQILLSNGTSQVPADSDRGSIKFIIN